MLLCDINCDMGEGIGNDEAIMPFITSANIACGCHAGDEATMQQTILLAKQYGVKVGAHPSFLDKENFGRTEMHCSADEVYALVAKQINIIKRMADECGVALHHVKPHGALYNMAARDKALAAAIAKAVKEADENLILYGLSGSYLINEAKAIGLNTASEVFADRTYSEDGSLTPRKQANALIEDEERAIKQVLQMVKEKTVTATTGKRVPLAAETICIHGDGKNAVAFAKRLNEELTMSNENEER